MATDNKIIDPKYFKPVLDYNQQNAARILQLGAPLKDCFGIDAFAYARIYDNGRYVLLTNNDVFLMTVPTHDYLHRTEYFGNMVQRFCRYEPCMDIWPEKIKDDCIETYRANNLHNGFSIAQERENTFECMWFSTIGRDSDLRGFYAQHASTMAEYMKYFTSMGSDLCYPADGSKMGTSPFVRQAYQAISDIFATSTPWERQIERFTSQLSSLAQHELLEIARSNNITLRELECLTLFTANKTAKEIARVMGVSYRTVERHLENIRFKTGYMTKQELTQWFQSKFHHVLKHIPSRVIV